MRNIILITILSYTFVNAATIEHFLMPKDGNLAQRSLISNIKSARHSIDIAMFMITNKKLTQAIKERAKKGNITIRIIADKSYDQANKKKSTIKDLLQNRTIKVYLTNGLKKNKKNKYGILHSKLVLIDNMVTYIGSTNWTKSAFRYNYEILLKITDNTTAKLYRYYFDEILTHAVPISRLSNRLH